MSSAPQHEEALPRPAQVCQALLRALDAAEGRRRSRKRDQTPDTVGLAVKRQLLQQVVIQDPAPDRFEEWLLAYTRGRDGAVAAMVRAVYDEWRLAHDMHAFAVWLRDGAPSDDARPS